MNFQHWLNKEFNNKIVDQEQIDLWNKYLLVEPDNNVYDYLNDFLVDIINKPNAPELSATEINLCGSRFGAKTYNVCDLIALIIAISYKYDFNVAIYGFRYLSADIQELRKNIDNCLKRIGFERKTNQSGMGDYLFVNGQNKPTYKFTNGSFIELKGVYNSTGKASLKGLADANGCSLAISICEEANEFTKKNFQEIESAIRGAEKRLRIKMSNPDSQYQDYIAYCIKRVRFNEKILETKGQQLTTIKENEIIKIFHYTNYMTNPYLTKDEVLNMLEMKVLDPVKYKIWGIGMPGNTESSIFGHYLDKVEENNLKDFRTITFTGGVDLGQADTPTGHPTYAILTGYNQRDQIKPLNEFFHNNYTMPHKDPNELANSIVDFYIKCSDDYPLIKKKGINVYVDYGAGGKSMIALINNIIKELNIKGYNLNWLKVIEVDKEVWTIKDRIDAIVIMINRNQLMIEKQLTPNLLEQLSLMKWKEPRNNIDNYILKPLDKFDDCFDSLCYSMMPNLLEVLNNKNNQLLLTKAQTSRIQRTLNNQWELQDKGW